MVLAPEGITIGETCSRPRKSGKRCWLAMALILGASLIIPATREVHLVALQTLLHLPGRAVDAPLSPESMQLLVSVPLADSQRESCLKSAGQSPSG